MVTADDGVQRGACRGQPGRLVGQLPAGCLLDRCGELRGDLGLRGGQHRAGPVLGREGSGGPLPQPFAEGLALRAQLARGRGLRRHRLDQLALHAHRLRRAALRDPAQPRPGQVEGPAHRVRRAGDPHLPHARVEPRLRPVVLDREPLERHPQTAVLRGRGLQVAAQRLGLRGRSRQLGLERLQVRRRGPAGRSGGHAEQRRHEGSGQRRTTQQAHGAVIGSGSPRLEPGTRVRRSRAREPHVRIGVLTGGGDCPGLNAVIRAVVRKGVEVHGHEFVGFRDGWRGPLEKHTMPLGVAETRGILPRGGTILGSSRTNVMKVEDGVETVRRNLEELGVDALVAIGGEDTLGVATKLAAAGLNVVGVPKTIDNDLGATDYTFGFDTAVQIAVDAIDRLHTTAESHHRALIVEVMGRHAGWIALHSGLAGGANVILIPERPFDIDKVCEYVEARFARQFAPILVVAEGAQPKEGTLALQTGDVDSFGHVRLGGIGQVLEREIEARTGYESRQTVLGHVQRGGTPTAFDRILATRFGIAAADCVQRRRQRQDGRAAGHRHRARPARGGDPRAQDGAGRALRRGRGLLRLTSCCAPRAALRGAGRKGPAVA